MGSEVDKLDFSLKPKGLKQGVVANFPFKPRVLEEDHDHSNLASCGIYKLLPDRMKKEVEKNLHLLEYLHILPLDKIGIPKFAPKLDRKKHGDLDRPNLIYPADEQIYIHVYPDKNDMRNFYIPIEPTLLTGVDELLKEVEIRLVDYITDIDFDPEDNEEKIKILKEALREVCEIVDKEESFMDDSRGEVKLTPKFRFPFRLPFWKNGKNGSRAVMGKLKVTKEQFKALEYALIRDKVGLGVLEPYIRDKYIEDISCSGLGPIFVEHKIFKGLKSVIEFRDEETLNKFIIRLAERIGKPVTYKDPIVDATLPDGSRINIVFGNDISKNGSNFTIRKFNETPFSVLQLIEFGSLDYMIAGYLWLLISEGMSGFICGETASGKTTLLNAITAFIRPEAKVVSIEDTPELQVPHKNWTREVTRGSTRAGGIGEGGGSDVTMFDLLKAALRQRPNYILVGEIRGVEGNIAFQAMQTGHPVMSTFHAATVEKLIQRLTTEPISVPKTFIDNLNFVVIQSAVRRPDGKLVRRVLSVSEIVGYNPQKGGVSFIEVFQWDPVTDTHVFTGYGSSYLLEQKIATRLGIPPNKKKLIYEEVEKRAKILKKLHEQGVTDFYEFFKSISKIYKSGLLAIKV
ncbi:type II/IV secretion system ATPase subunit [Archaeoglobus fulgidus]|uniref:Type II secretion system protein (GspE-4) n=2 Tax=Archaeoglobus fulgidus TaxID=2234 RepID=O29213_ARCFU|nr:ATPase, T2SS/T4P/T4SS family [Archaeoglobus fulgidus]AAB90188.1 type II secretion system protein (gspE-4) [Archaeoglobus fulgidus DSM 4304]KUJ94030.1 MAG: Type II secretion system protein (GspE-4) [Archaeoglobus fulgidus]KUK06595.1 MAG: Type II secretion system protein (GspE-4) [Archaeoglobus fulgidus]